MQAKLAPDEPASPTRAAGSRRAGSCWCSCTCARWDVWAVPARGSCPCRIAFCCARNPGQNQTLDISDTSAALARTCSVIPKSTIQVRRIRWCRAIESTDTHHFLPTEISRLTLRCFAVYTPGLPTVPAQINIFQHLPLCVSFLFFFANKKSLKIYFVLFAVFVYFGTWILVNNKACKQSKRLFTFFALFCFFVYLLLFTIKICNKLNSWSKRLFFFFRTDESSLITLLLIW